MKNSNTFWLILAGILANSGELANVVRFSTASVRGLIAAAVFCLFLSVGSWSKALNKNKKEKLCHQKKLLKNITNNAFL